MAVSIEQFAAILTGADYLAEIEDRPVMLSAKYLAKTGDSASDSVERIFIPLGEAWQAASSGLWSFRCVRLDSDTGDWDFKVYNLGRFQTLPVEIPTEVVA